MWEYPYLALDPRTVKASVTRNGTPLSFGEVIELWRRDPEFRTSFTAALKAAPFEAFFWETPAVRRETLGQAFEFVFVDAPPLLRLRPEPDVFAEHFAGKTNRQVLRFPNLGGDAVLIVPAPLAKEECYVHLARFIRSGPVEQVDEFWRQAGEALAERISAEPSWLSTAGLGVSWLHLRVDSRPKYYRHTPYKSAC